jgi:hypothetical protein
MRSEAMTIRSILAGAAMACFAGGCGSGSPTSPSPANPLSETLERPGISFHFAAGDSVQADWQVQYDTWVTSVLGVSPTRTITYNKYRDRAHMGQVIGVSNTNGFADAATFTVQTIWPIDNHEVVHLYTSAFGSPVALFSEGFAVAHQMNPASNDLVAKWSGTPVHDLARQFRSAGRLVSLDTIVETAGFRTVDPNVSYPESGSFMRFLIDSYGLEPVKRLFAAGTPTDSRDVSGRAFSSIFGMTLADAERAWWAFLDR